MIAEIVCNFCLCLVLNNKIRECHKCQNNVPKQTAIDRVFLLTEPNEFMSLQCFEKGKKPELDWGNKKGMW
jgi:hypothetical protein